MAKRLIERTVQEIAQDHLVQYYRIKHNEDRIYSQLEARTRRKYGGKRADGLLAYKKNEKKAFVASMEAKSYKTLPALKPYRVDRLWIQESIWVGLLVCLGSGSLFMMWRWVEYDFFRFFIPILVWLAGGIVYAILSKSSYKFQEMEVIKQVFQYPGDEQWLSFSEDALNDISVDLRDNLFKICKARGVGVVLVDGRKQVSMVSKAKRRSRWFKSSDCLKYYSNEDIIVDYLRMKPREK